MNPVMSADLRAAFGRTGELRATAAFLAALAVVLYAWWPRSDLAWHVRTATPPQTFEAVSIGLFLLAGYLNARSASGEHGAGAGDRAAARNRAAAGEHGASGGRAVAGDRAAAGAHAASSDGAGSSDHAAAGDHASAQEATLADLVALTPVRIVSVVAGRMAAGALVVLFQIALAVPFLVAALGVSGVPASVLPAVVAVIAAAALAWRASALALQLLLPEHPILRDALLLASSVTWLAVASVAAPALSPIVALLDLAGGGHRALAVAGASLPFFAVSAIIAVLVIAVAGLVAWAALRAARAAARRTAPAPEKDHDRGWAGPRD